MPRLRVSTGIQLYYESYGQGPPLIMIDGVGGRWVWYRNVSALSRYFRVIILDIRGVGNSDRPMGPYSMPMLARDVADVILRLGLGPTAIAGLSLGALIAFELALMAPQLVARLILIGSTPGGPTQVPSSPMLPALTTPIPGAPPAINGRRYLATILTPDFIATHPAVVDQILAWRQAIPATPNSTRLAQGVALATWPGMAGRASGVRQPALVLHGNRDLLVPVANGIQVARLLPRASLRIFPNAAHAVELQEPEVFHPIVTRFLLG